MSRRFTVTRDSARLTASMLLVLTLFVLLVVAL